MHGAFMNMNSAILFLSANLLVNSAFAGSMGPIQANWNWVATLSAGPVWQNGGKTQTFNLAPEIRKSYIANTNTQTLFDGEVFLGLQKRLTATVLGQLGVAVAATSNAELSGRIWDDADPQFDNFIYRYKIQHTQVAAKAKLLTDLGFWVMPWLSGSVGIGFNHAHSFDNIPTIFEALPTPNFSSRNTNSFTYTVGAGLQKPLSEHCQVGVGYEFADWGRSALGRAVGQTLNTGLVVNHLYTQGVLFNVTFLS
jgi:opacity protein-like surface antigen